ncbi:MAG: hypothetical protein QXS81_05030 [Candidatus Micrarchaeaceae archaeon]
MDLDTIIQPFIETKDAIMADTDRLIGIFVFGAVIVAVLTGMQYAIMFNSAHNAALSYLAKSGVCSTIAPYLITSTGGAFGGVTGLHVGMCQLINFNYVVEIAWYLQTLAIEFIAILVFEMIFHMG